MTMACELSAARKNADSSGRLDSLPLVTLYLTERCNSRCVSCDYWRHGFKDMKVESVKRLLPSLRALRTEIVVLSGGEPLVNPHWAEIAALLGAAGLKLWLLTSGLALAKHSARVAGLFQTVTVSLDGAERATYAAIRGVDAFDKVCAGIRNAVGAGCAVTLRVTVQRGNYRELPRFVPLAHQLGVKQISFLAADVGNVSAFGRDAESHHDIALSSPDLPEFARVLNEMERAYDDDFRSRFIAENPAKLQRILHYYTAVRGLGVYPPVRCNAPAFSAVIGADGHLQPCFFIRGPGGATVTNDIDSVLNGESMMALRDAIRAGRRPECRTCVCSAWRDPGRFGRDGGFLSYTEAQ